MQHSGTEKVSSIQLMIILISFELGSSIVTYFLYIAARVTRDLIELLDTSIYPATPHEFFAFTFLLVIAYILHLGIEPFARTVEILIPYVAGFFVLMLILLIINRSITVSNLYPVLPDGWGPVLRAAFPKVVTFPFGEMIALTVVMAQTEHHGKLMPLTLSGIAVSGVILAFVSFLQVTVLTSGQVSRNTFPLLSVNRSINVGFLFERLEGIVVFLMMMGIFVKLTIFLYAGLKGIEYMTGRAYRFFLVPVAILVALISMWTADGTRFTLMPKFKLMPTSESGGPA